VRDLLFGGTNLLIRNERLTQSLLKSPEMSVVITLAVVYRTAGLLGFFFRHLAWQAFAAPHSISLSEVVVEYRPSSGGNWIQGSQLGAQNFGWCIEASRLDVSFLRRKAPLHGKCADESHGRCE
jgi:hypothetical protein